MSHEELNPYHRLLGRILIALFSCHAALYINFYIQSNLLHRFGSQTVILGLIAITIFILLGTSSLAKIRDYSYLLFFVLHVALSIAILPVLWFHVSHLRVYIIESALIYILLIAQRNLSQTSTLATLSLSSQSHQTSLLSISFPVPRSKLRSYAPGQHIYLGLPPSSLLTKPWEKLRLNPFTIASISDPLSSLTTSAIPTPTAPSAKTPQLTLLIRPLRSSTAILRSLALSSTKEQPIPVLVEGPYGSASYFPDLSLAGFEAVLLVAGGVGATFTLPIYRDLCLRRGAAREGGVKMVWSVRRREEMSFGLEMLGDEGMEGTDVYVTGQTGASAEGNGDGDGDIELEERAGLLDDDGGLNTKDLTIHQGRPDLRGIVRDVFERRGEGKVAVLVCGPSGMGRALRREVGVWVGRGREVFWHVEQFGW
ncbi:hypothetical protein G7Y79_00004g012680 [Physcia stellaris]|nr:hypothetical protein G7Y79_00004g012680 [Physcia stellaris]